MARAFKETLEPGDTEDVIGQSDASHGFSRYAFHDIKPVTMTEAVVIVVTDSSGKSVRDFVQPQYLAAVLASTFLGCQIKRRERIKRSTYLRPSESVVAP